MTNIRIDELTELHPQLSHLATLDRQKLADLWVKQFKHPPPKGSKRGLVERAEAYRLQAKRHGRLRSELRRRLVSIATGP